MKKILIYPAIFLLASLILSCSSGKEFYTQSIDLVNKGKYEDAFEKLKSAIEKEPDNEEYQAQLEKVKIVLVEKYLTSADKHLNFQTVITISALNNARKDVAKAKLLSPNNVKAGSFQKKINKLELKLDREIKRAYSRGIKKMQKKKWLSANKYFLEINHRYPGYKDSKKLLQEAVNNGTKMLFEKGTNKYDAELFREAKHYFSMVLTLNPVHLESSNLFKLAKEKDSINYFIKEANKAKNAKKWDRAVYAYKRALGYAPKDRSLKRIIPRIKRMAGMYYVDKAKQDIKDGFLLKALRGKLNADKYLKRRDTNRRRLSKEILRQMRSAADKYKQDKMYGAALFWYTKIKSVSPRYRKIFYLIQSMRDKIRKRVVKAIAVYDFRSPVKSKDAGVIISNNLITYLFKNMKKDVRILEREKLKSLIEEMQLGQTGVVSENTAQAMGTVQGVDTAIQGNVMLYNVESTQTKNLKTATYETGRTRIEDNMTYLNWKARNPEPTEEQLKAAPPAKIRVPIRAEKDYTVTTYKKVGFVQVNFHVIDVKTGKKVFVDTIKEKKTISDTSSPGIRKAGIKEDPLVILTDTGLLQLLSERVIKKLGEKIMAPFDDIAKEYINKGDEHMGRREYLLAIEKYYNSYYDEKLKNKRFKGTTALDKIDETFLNLSIKTNLMVQREKQAREREERMKAQKALATQKEAQLLLDQKKRDEEKKKALLAKEEADKAKAEELKKIELEKKKAIEEAETRKKAEEEVEAKKKAAEQAEAKKKAEELKKKLEIEKKKVKAKDK
jgi:hypothetical protein